MMIESIQFKNLKALQDTTLPLSQFTLIIGPNGSGKSTAMQALKMALNPSVFTRDRIVTIGLPLASETTVEVIINWRVNERQLPFKTRWTQKGNDIFDPRFEDHLKMLLDSEDFSDVWKQLQTFKIFSFDAQAIAAPVNLAPSIELASNGANLAAVLDNLRDGDPERFEALNEELGRWLPEFDRILFETPAPGQRAFLLRTRRGRHRIQAADLSHGTLFALAFLTLAYLPNPPAIVCFEDPEQGIHPRLLREIQDGMYRLCYPQSYGEQRLPVQVIATTHSPYLLDLYKDHPKEIVIAQKDEQGTHFERLSDKPNIDEYLQDASLGEMWYSGVLGGVPNIP